MIRRSLLSATCLQTTSPGHRLLRATFASKAPSKDLRSDPADPITPPLHAAPTASSSQPLPSVPRLKASLPRLRALASRTGVPLPSLALSFLILHELTALIPLILFYFIFQALGAGGGIVAWIASLASDIKEGGEGWDWRSLVGRWYEEGQKRVERAGRLYGILGYDQMSKPELGGDKLEVKASTAAEKVADAIAAYIVVKVLRHLVYVFLVDMDRRSCR